MTRKAITTATTPPLRTPPKQRTPKRGRKREALPVIDVSRGPVVLEDSYAPGGDPDDT